MKIHVLTLFPEMVYVPCNESMLKIAQQKGLVSIDVIDIRDFASDVHHTCDDRPYGGGPGMVMMIEPIYKALESCKTEEAKVILLSPQGQVLNQKLASDLSCEKHLIFICGHYEGVDDRVRTQLADMELSIGDYVLTNGSLASVVAIDACVRLIPGVLGSEESLKSESFSGPCLEYPQYTRPREFRGEKVPEVLFNGNHELIRKWRREESEKRTRLLRPDLLESSEE